MLLRHVLRPLTPTISTQSRTTIIKHFSHTPSWQAKQMPPRPTVPETDLQEAFLKGSGPGGQKINKTSSAVQLKHLPTGLVVKSQATRSRTQNRKIARRLLAEKLEVIEKGTESRVMVKGEVKRKKKASRDKKARRKYRALEEGKVRSEDLSIGVDGLELKAAEVDGEKAGIAGRDGEEGTAIIKSGAEGKNGKLSGRDGKGERE